MAMEKILILEAPWSDEIEDTRATREIYSSAETLLSVHPEPLRIIQRPLILSTYINDIERFVSLDCNLRGPNVVIFSAHGVHSLVSGKKHRRELQAFDGDINISKEVTKLNGKLGRTIFILDACKIGIRPKSFRQATGALAVIGFTKTVDWIDSSIFVLAVLLRLQQTRALHLKRALKNTKFKESTVKKVIEGMTDGVYKSLASSLGVQHDFA
jgi:hypothetical protein